jgi:hypothetical protein
MKHETVLSALLGMTRGLVCWLHYENKHCMYTEQI